MAILLQNKPNVVAPGGAYPFGNIKDNTGANDGTPLNTLVHADFHQFFAKMLDDSGIGANGLPDNSVNGFQYYLALLAVIKAKTINEDWQTSLFSSNTDGILFKKCTDGFVEIYGVLSYLTARTLPVGYRPVGNYTFTSGVAVQNSGTPVVGAVQINIANTGVITTTPALTITGGGAYANIFVNLKFTIL